MFKVNLVIPIVTVIFLMTAGNSFAQETTSVHTPVLSTNLATKDLNPNSGLFKLYDTQQTKFENTTVIKFELGEEADVLLTVIDSRGKILATLIDDTMYAGVYDVNYKSAEKITSGELTYKLEVKGVSGIKNVFAVK